MHVDLNVTRLNKSFCCSCYVHMTIADNITDYEVLGGSFHFTAGLTQCVFLNILNQLNLMSNRHIYIYVAGDKENVRRQHRSL